MRLPSNQMLFGVLLAALWLTHHAPGYAASEHSEDVAFFENRIRPVLVEHCYDCHSADADSIEGELTLDSRAAVQRGGRSGAVIVPGDPAASTLLRAIEYEHTELQMPPTGKLPDEVIADVRRWIEVGAPDPREGQATPINTIDSRAASHWAFQSLQRPQQPEVEDGGWSSKPLDQFVFSELANARLEPSPAATRGELIRRLYFDLVGLPPTWVQVEAFETNESSAAYDELVDQLLESPQFGERWARHWLDLARFADTKGYVFTEKRDFPNAYKYRDWVIEAFNDDMPIDQFMRYQLAADLMIEGDQQKHHLAAQGFVTLGRRFINNQHDIVADRIDVIFRSMMGLTVACARCHDHKFDPITDEDYYALYGIFASSKEVQDDDLPLRLVEKEKPQNVGVFIRGNDRNRTKPVARGFPAFFDNFASSIPAGSGRLQLAQAITHPENPLTARVFVNRVWGHLFGEQLVGSPSDFGLSSEAPRQQAVLDLLASDFVSNGWSLKWLVRELVTSSTYCQSSNADSSHGQADPENQLWGRMNRRRLDFESLRDNLLEVSGRLEHDVGGKSERIDTEAGSSRRTLYAHIDRQNLPGLFRAFDFASPDAHSPERPHTLVPQQPLFLLNSTMVQRAAQDVVSALKSESPVERIGELYRKVLSRPPNPNEVQLAQQFLQRHQPETLPTDEWSFGFGTIRDFEQHGKVEMQPLSHFVDNRWQQKSEFPEKQFGHLCLTATGGHPGDRPELSPVRRWTAPEAGELRIKGELKHPSEKGDGVVARIVSSRSGVLASWTIKNESQRTSAGLAHVEPGDTIDFVVSCRGNPGWDSFTWPVSLALETPTGWQHWSSQQDFRGPPPEPLDLWAQLAQVLLVSNEFLYVD